MASREPLAAHHADVGIHEMVRMLRTAERRRGDRIRSRVSGPLAARRVGKEGHEVRGDADRADARSAAAVRDRKGLVQIEMANIRAACGPATVRPTWAFMFAPSM